MKRYFMLALAACSLAACEPAPRQECVQSHTEEAETSDVVAMYMVTGSKMMAYAASQDRVVCDRWETVE